MKIKLMLDEDVQIELASALKAKGIDAISKQLSISQALKGLLSLVDTLPADEMANRLEFLSNWVK